MKYVVLVLIALAVTGCARFPKYNCDTIEYLTNPRCV